MRFKQPAAPELRWTVVVVSVGVVLITLVAIYWTSTASFSLIAQ